MSSHQLRVDWPACKAHGLCAELLPEVVSLDEWGYPIVHDAVKDDLLVLAKAAVKACPTLALRLIQPPPRHS
ncbi:MAG: ferredoxin [Actinomycetota bacterium]